MFDEQQSTNVETLLGLTPFSTYTRISGDSPIVEELVMSTKSIECDHEMFLLNACENCDDEAREVSHA